LDCTVSPEHQLPSSNLRDQLQATLSGGYSLERELGRDGMSHVFLGKPR
jgi:hypothetical protein